MPELPVVSGRGFIKVVSKLGYVVDRQHGSHVIVECSGRKPLSVPLHKELKPGVLRGLVRDAGITMDEFVALLKGR